MHKKANIPSSILARSMFHRSFARGRLGGGVNFANVGSNDLGDTLDAVRVDPGTGAEKAGKVGRANFGFVGYFTRGHSRQCYCVAKIARNGGFLNKRICEASHR